MQTVAHAAAEAVNAIITWGVRKGTKYLSPTLVVKATMRKSTRNTPKQEILVTIGGPNYREREFIKAARQAGEPFPISQVQVRPWPRQR
jgi:hypothetical protein